MNGPLSRLFFAKSIPPISKGKLSPESEEIFVRFSSGLSEEAILAGDSTITRADIIKAAREALIIHNAAHRRDKRAQKILKSYPRAYEKWCPSEEERVTDLYNAGKTMREIAAAVQRQPNAIKNRLEKLGIFAFGQHRP